MDPKQPSSGHETGKPAMPAAYFNRPIFFRQAKSESCVPGGLTDIHLGLRQVTTGRFFDEMMIPMDF
jgi:hypothetical protein